MTTTNQSSKKRLSFILYEWKKSPKYFELNKSFIRFMVTVIPVITLITSAIIAVGIIYFKEIKNHAQQKEPAIIADLKEQNAEKTVIVNKQQELINRLQQKVAKLDPAMQTGLLPSDKPAGKSATAKTLFTIDNIQITPSKEKVNLKFDLMNMTPNNKRLSGYISIVMKSNSSIHFYPKNSIAKETVRIDYTKGESFTTSRFRPVDADFPIYAEADHVLFKVYIFSRSGDVVLEQDIPFEIPKTN